MKYILVFLIFIFLWACKSESPLDSYSDDQLIAILVDVQLANGAVENSSKKIQDSLKSVYGNQIATIHDIEPKELVEIVDKIHLDLPRYVIIIDSVHKQIDRLIDENKEAKKKGKKEPEKEKKKDNAKDGEVKKK